VARCLDRFSISNGKPWVSKKMVKMEQWVSHILEPNIALKVGVGFGESDPSKHLLDIGA